MSDTPVPIPMSERYGTPALTRTGYIAECEHRYSPSAIEHHVKWCMKISDAVNSSVGTDPIMCAKCRLKGPVNEDFLRLTSLSIMSSYLSHAILGFNQSEAEIVDLLSRTYVLLFDAEGVFEPERIGRFKNTILELITHNRITEETALAFCEDKEPLK